MKWATLFCLSAMTALLISSTALASVQMTFNSVGPSVGGFNLVTGIGGNQTVTAGRMNWTVTATDANLPPVSLGSFATFCIELGQTISGGSSVSYDKTPVANAPNQLPLGNPPYGVAIGSARADFLDELAEIAWATATTTTTNSVAAAFQLAVWEIVHEGYNSPNNTPPSSFNVLTGSFNVTNAGTSGAKFDAVTQANTWLSGLTGTPSFPGVSIYALTNATRQDQIFQYTSVGTDIASAPEPASLLVWGGIGLVGLGIVALKKKAT